MKQLRFLLPLGAVLACLTACLPSVSPFYQADDVQFDPRLLGQWQERGDSPESWAFERAGDQAYQLTVTDKGKQGTFAVRLFRLKNDLYLDLVPADCKFDSNQADMVGFAMFPGHLLVAVRKMEPELQLAFCDYDWLGKFLKSHPKALAHHSEENRLVLTANTTDLQRFIQQHRQAGELFQEPTDFVRTTK